MASKATPVVFRTFPSGEVIALFPILPADQYGGACLSYLHIGQHGAADARFVIRKTAPSRPSEYRDLAKELRSIGYKLTIHKRITATMVKIRRALARRQSRG